MKNLLEVKSALPAFVENFFDKRGFFPGLMDFNGGTMMRDFAANFPAVNIFEEDAFYKFEMAAPGFTKKDFNIEIEDNFLTISAKKKEEKNIEKKNYARKEFFFDSFTRTFEFPKEVIFDKIDAQYNDGVLMLTVPKKDMKINKPKFEIKVS